MAFDQSTRNLLANLVSECRRLLSAEFTAKLQELYGIQPTGEVADVASLTQLTDEQREVARLLRERIAHIQAGLTAGGAKPEAAARDAVQRVIREQAFTVLNRLAALRLCEERGIVLECVRQGVNSEGFQLFRQSAGSALGDNHETYVAYLHCLFDDLAQDLGVLFDRFSPMALLFPRRDTLTRVLAELSGTGPTAAREKLGAEIFAQIWQADETIGWIYQYWNDPAERKKMREESSAPRNSRELAVRNQFFTPRYVVEFLTDNTLGRIWYEMTQGDTTLKEQCRYLVRRPNEIFLQPGESAPEQPKQDNLSQEDLLKQPVFIPHRPLKDPRTILMLDPACGSMHFGLYAFDLFEVIYVEWWDQFTTNEQKAGVIADCQKALKIQVQEIAGADERRTFFLRQVPRLIIEHNLHGIDIDPRCAQIAGLSLWLRAQKAWQRLGLKPAERPAIKRSNIVCAEPMPGEKELLREFVEREFPVAERAVCLRLLEAIFDKMQLAGEAGSLLKIEEEIRSAIEDARDAWQKLTTRPPELFTTTELHQLSTAPELTGLEQAVSSLTTDPRHLTTDFWERIEERIYAALRDYAEQAENGGGFQRRLFAEDAARGFAFIDVCRKRYDVALMNPPFGSFSKLWLDEAKLIYPNSYSDILGAFIERFLEKLTTNGRIGAITSRTCFFLTSFTTWRQKVVLPKAAIHLIADLGQGVMDAAMVEAAAYVLESGPPPQEMAVIRAIADKERQSVLSLCVDCIAEAKAEHRLFRLHQSRFALAPNSAFTYWVSDNILRKLNGHSPIEGECVAIRVGLQTGEDFRFLRQWWEIPTELVAPNPSKLGKNLGHISLTDELRKAVAAGARWVRYSKTDFASPWYSPLLQVVNWTQEGREYEHFLDSKGKSRAALRSREMYLKPGFSYMLRSSRIVPYAVPAGVIPTAGRAQAFPIGDNVIRAFGLCASNVASAVARFSGEKFAWPKFQASMVQAIPSVELSGPVLRKLDSLIRAEISGRRTMFQGYEPFIEFVRPSVLNPETRTYTLNRESLLGSELEADVASAYGLNQNQLTELERDIHEAVRSQSSDTEQQVSGEDEDEAGEAIVAGGDYEDKQGLISYTLGVAFGRWDIRYATGEQAAPELPDPFAPLPVCPPGQLQNAQGLPLGKDEVGRMKDEGGWDYPIEIPWDGILVDDPNHPLDLERRVREVIEIIWSGQEGGPTAEAIEHEACEILGVKSLRDYFRKPAGFFADHLKRYSKSRRQAPIYWPLSTASGSYTLWIYYHRLTDQTLYKCIQQFIDPRLADVEKELAHLRSVLDSGEGSTKTRRQLDDAEQLRTELKEMRAELEHWASRWKPNLNDGVLITACPLWKLFRLPKWRKDLEACWKELEAGDYDWAHLAHTLWPDRVRPKCKTDRSLAIAHGLEELCEVAAPKPKAKRAAKADAAAKEREAKKEALREQLTEALANILLGEKLPLDVTNAQTGEPIIPANRKITKTLLRKLASGHDHADIAPSPTRDKIREIIAPFEPRFAALEQADQQVMAMEAE